MNQLDWVRTLDDRRQFFKHQLGLLATRWGAIVLVGFFLTPLIPMAIYGPLLIVVYAAATIALELAPGPVLNALARWTGAGATAAVAKSVAKSTAASWSSVAQQGK